jgi:hypothetical protein
MQYKLKPLEIKADSVEEIKFPSINERIIEMHGQVVEVTLQGIADTQLQRSKKLKELIAKKELEEKKMENIESFHKFVKKMSDEDLHTAWMYYQCKALVSECGKEAEKIQGWIDNENEELEEIKRQCPELAEVISPYNNEPEVGGSEIIKE